MAFLNNSVSNYVVAVPIPRRHHTVVPGFNGGQRLLVLLNQIGQLVHQIATVRRRQVFPGRILECLASSLDGKVDILRTSSIDGRDLRFVPVRDR